jgi:ribosome-binding factor A
VTTEPSHRVRRVAESIKQVVTDFMARELSDPTLSAVAITDVELTADLGIATVKARLYVGGDDSARREAVVKSLSRAAGRIRRHLGRAVRLKRVPELRFVYDRGADATEKVESILSEIKEEGGQ